MKTGDAFTGLVCFDCDETVTDPLAGRCPACGGVLDASYDYGSIDVDRAEFAGRESSQWRYREFLPVARDGAVSLAEGGTPTVDVPDLAADADVGRVVVADEGRNPTGTVADRGVSLAVSAALASDAERVVLASTGNDGQSVAAYAARAGLDATIYVPSRADFTTKAMVNVHGATMDVVGGRYDDAVAACRAATGDDEFPVGVGATPYRHEGAKSLYYELVADLDWTVPDAVVYPTAHGAGVVGLFEAAHEWLRLGLTDDVPALYAAQPEGCAPLVEAAPDGPVERWETPDTICGGLEVPDPELGPQALRAIRESGGDAVAVPDDDALAAAVAVAGREGIEIDAACGVAAAATWDLAGDVFGPDDTVAVVNTGVGARDDDVLRSHLMGQGL
ncbi:threonine synthase [Halobacteriales archaeon SW_7_68_16]|nr:MAG: threonine synthase [Halobacteriales archaeon SW_7_68_16]